MINLRENLTKKNVLIAALLVALLLTLQTAAVRMVRARSEDAAALISETNTLDNMLKKRTDALLRSKAAMTFDAGLLPVPADTPTQFFVSLTGILSSEKLDGAEILKSAESPDSVSFSVKGEAPYFALMHFLADLRQGQYMSRLVGLTLDGRKDGIVSYSLVIQAKIKSTEPQEKPAGGNAQ